MAKRRKKTKSVETLTHGDATRKNLPSAEHQPLMQEEDKSPLRVAYERRNRDLDPQLVWRGKDEQDWSNLVVNAPPLYIQERVHPKVLVDDLMRQSEQARRAQDANIQPGFADLFADFNGLPSEDAKTEFYQHDANWSNRMVLGDSLRVMASLAEREGLRGKVQCIYIDPPYGIKFNSNFQWSTTSRDVRDGKADHITREPEQVKAFRDTWRDGIHSYLTYLRDRLTVARDLLTESGSIFVQIGDENIHRVRAVLDEVFGARNFISQIVFTKTTGLGSVHQLPGRYDLLIWYAKSTDSCKYRALFELQHDPKSAGYTRVDAIDPDIGPYMSADLTKPGPGQKYSVQLFGRTFDSGRRWWGFPPESIQRMFKAGRLEPTRSLLRYKRYHQDYPLASVNNLWTGLAGATHPRYVVETNEVVIQRCIS